MGGGGVCGRGAGLGGGLGVSFSGLARLGVQRIRMEGE